MFEKGNAKALADAIMKTWEEEALVKEMTANEVIRAGKTHNADENYKALLDIYKNITDVLGDETI